MKRIRQVISKAAGTAALAAAVLALAPSSARADNIVFTVDESAITGAGTDTFQADRISGAYNEYLVLDTMTGTFTSYIVVNYSDYKIGTPSVTVPSNLTSQPAGSNTEEYGMYALVIASGQFTASPGVGLGGAYTDYDFYVTSATGSVYSDPLQNTTFNVTSATTTGGVLDDDDQQLLTAAAPDQLLSGGTIRVLTSTGGITFGSYGLVFTNVALTSTGDLYWPTLSLLKLQASATGDIDSSTQGNTFPSSNLYGEADLTFQQIPTVPEPASLVLLGTGLLTAGAARRRSKNKKQ